MRLDALRFRTLRAAFVASTMPSLHLAASAAPAAGAPGSFLLQLQGLNLQGLEGFKLTGLSLPGGAWVARELADESEPGAGQARSSLALGVDLGPEASAGMHFHLTPRAGAAGEPSALSPVEAYLCGSTAPAGAPAGAPEQRGADGKPPLGLSSVQPVHAVLKWTTTGASGGPPAAGFHSISKVRCVPRPGEQWQ